MTNVITCIPPANAAPDHSTIMSSPGCDAPLGPFSRLVCFRGWVDVEWPLLPLFTERLWFELTPIHLRAYHDKALEHRLWSMRCCNMELRARKFGDGIVVSGARRRMTFYPPNADEHKRWTHALTEATTKDVRRFLNLSQKLGDGAFSSVYLADVAGEPDRKSQPYAVKRVHKEATGEQSLRRMRREFEIQQRLSHENIVQLVDVFETPAALFIVMERVHGGMLLDRLVRLRHFGEHDAKHVMHQILTAVAYCHARSIVHRDLKLENILCVDEDTIAVKVADFGLSVESHVSMDGSLASLRSRVGTRHYMAPEVCRGSGYGDGADVWSCGVILHALLSGELPYNQRDIAFDRYGAPRFESPAWRLVSPHAKRLVLAMLQVDATKRLSAYSALHHSWFDDAKLTNGDVPRTSGLVSTASTSELSEAAGDSKASLGVDFAPLRRQSLKFRRYVNLVVALCSLRERASSNGGGVADAPGDAASANALVKWDDTSPATIGATSDALSDGGEEPTLGRHNMNVVKAAARRRAPRRHFHCNRAQKR